MLREKRDLDKRKRLCRCDRTVSFLHTKLNEESKKKKKITTVLHKCSQLLTLQEKKKIKKYF